MEQGAWLPTCVPEVDWKGVGFDVLAKPSILLIEDDGDVRDLLITLLRLAGFQVVAARTAEEGLEQLRETTFDLLLTDYCLPHRTGGWLIEQASAEGFLDDVPALVVTAYPHPVAALGVETISKPFDLDDLVGRVRELVAGRKPRKPSSAGPSAPPADENGRPDRHDRIEVVLYVSAADPRSLVALDNIRAALSRIKSSRVVLTIRHVPHGHPAAEVTRSSAQHQPGAGPRTLILGHLTNPALLLEILEVCQES
jgi:CheY-like chemotaxis protein